MRLDSPDAPDAHFGNQRRLTWTGDNVHVTEPCADATLHGMTHVETTEAAVTDVSMTEPIQPALSDTQMAPDTQLVDAGDVDATLLVQSPRDVHLALMGPVPTESSWQAKAEHADESQSVPPGLGDPAGHLSTGQHPLVAERTARSVEQSGHQCHGR